MEHSFIIIIIIMILVLSFTLKIDRIEHRKGAALRYK